MAKILFAVNEHPDEAFAISVAKITKKILETAGHEVVWHKVKAKDTALGALLKAKKGKKFTDAELDKISKKARQSVLKVRDFVKPDITYDFHCSPHDAKWWALNGAGNPRRADYEIFYRNPKGDFRIIELKAHYKKLPKQIQKKISTATSARISTHEIYLTQTTSQHLTRNIGLNPKTFAQKISKKINQQIQMQQKRIEPSNVHGTIPRNKPTKKPNRKRRR